MTRAKARALGLGFAAVGSLVAALGGLPAEGQQPSSSAAVSPPALTMRPDPVDSPALSTIDLPTIKSDKPKRDEWGAARLVRVEARGARGRRCEAYLLREYMRVRCPQNVGAVRQLLGSTADVEVLVTTKPKDKSGYTEVWKPPHGGDVVFPLRKGESFLFQFFEIVEGYEGWGIGEGAMVDVSWPTSRNAPTVVVW